MRKANKKSKKAKSNDLRNFTNKATPKYGYYPFLFAKSYGYEVGLKK